MSKETKAPEWADFFVNRVVWGLIVMVILWIAITYYGPSWMLSRLNKDNMAAYGQVGDMFGMVNSLFSGLAFLAAIYAVILQTVEMREAGERRLEEENQQTEQMTIANETLKLQKQMKEHESSQLILRCLVDLNSDVSRVREAWIDMSSVYPESEKRNASARLEVARQELKADSFTVSMLFSNNGQQLNHLVEYLLNLTGDPEIPATPAGHRCSDLTLWFDKTSQEIKNISEALWRSQPGIVVAEFVSRIPDNTDKLYRLFTLYRLTTELRDEFYQSFNACYEVIHSDNRNSVDEVLRKCCVAAECHANELLAKCSSFQSAMSRLDLSVFEGWVGAAQTVFGPTSRPLFGDNNLSSIDELYKRCFNHLHDLMLSEEQGSA